MPVRPGGDGEQEVAPGVQKDTDMTYEFEHHQHIDNI